MALPLTDYPGKKDMDVRFKGSWSRSPMDAVDLRPYLPEERILSASVIHGIDFMLSGLPSRGHAGAVRYLRDMMAEAEECGGLAVASSSLNYEKSCYSCVDCADPKADPDQRVYAYCGKLLFEHIKRVAPFVGVWLERALRPERITLLFCDLPYELAWGLENAVAAVNGFKARSRYNLCALSLVGLDNRQERLDTLTGERFAEAWYLASNIGVSLYNSNGRTYVINPDHDYLDFVLKRGSPFVMVFTDARPCTRFFVPQDGALSEIALRDVLPQELQDKFPVLDGAWYPPNEKP